MKRVSISRLKARLSQYLEAVKAGEEVLVTDRGDAVARISPVAGEARQEGRTAALLRAGVLRPPRSSRPPEIRKLHRPADPEGRSLAALLEEREEAP